MLIRAGPCVATCCAPARQGRPTATVVFLIARERSVTNEERTEVSRRARLQRATAKGNERGPFALSEKYWVLWLGALINRLGSFVMPFLAIYLTEERGLERAQAGSIIALFGAGALLA